MTESTLPPHWKRVRLSDEKLFAFENGIWTGKKPPFVSCAVLRNTNFADDGTLDLSNVAHIEIEARQVDRKRCISGDIIIERSGGGPNQPVGRVALFDVPKGDFCFSNFTSRLRVIDTDWVASQYLHFFLFAFHLSGATEKLQKRTTGIRNLDFGNYKDSLIPLPPLPEQRAIANALQTVQDAKETRRRELELERERKAALMQHLFTYGTRGEPLKDTEIGKMPQSWDVTTLGEIAEIQSGSTPSRTNHKFYGGSIRWVKTLDLNEDFVNDTE